MATENSKCFCTIITANYLPYVLALNESLLQFDASIRLNVLISDKNETDSGAVSEFPNICFFFADDICRGGISKKIKDKYQKTDMDAFRWSMKPVFMRYLILEKGFEKVIYIDCDVHFYGDWAFLFDALDRSNMLLSPHWRSSDPEKDFSNFILLYTSGLYNGGFVAANQKAIDALDWWAGACEFICVKDASKGQYVDQTHLNLLPIYFDKVEVLKHRGCNVANWNQMECRRIRGSDNKVRINGETPIVFIHFTKSTVRGILSGNDFELNEYLRKYAKRMSRYGIDIQASAGVDGAADKKRTSRFFNSPFFKKLDKNGLIKKRIQQLAQRLFP